MEAAKRLMLNPEMILGPLRQLDKAEESERGRRMEAAHAAETELKRLRAEEERVLDAYRTGVISPARLGQQLEKIKTKRAALALQPSDAQLLESLPIEQVETAVSDYCAQAADSPARGGPLDSGVPGPLGSSRIGFRSSGEPLVATESS